MNWQALGLLFLCPIANLCRMEEIIQKIADLLDEGQIVYLHRETRALLDYPSSPDPEFDYLAEEVLQQVDVAPEAYIRFEPPTSSESYKFMENFAETRATEGLRLSLLRSLKSNHPFKSFRQTLRWERLEDEWYAYYDALLRVWVGDQMPETL